ncbi:unnamed protein product [Closterium sp. NIES-65]|nr:unnamed protein product [Closterium sp. NIES-65]
MPPSLPVLPWCQCCGKPREEEASVSGNGISCQQQCAISMLALLPPMLPVLRVLPDPVAGRRTPSMPDPVPQTPLSPPTPSHAPTCAPACISASAPAHAAPKSSLRGCSAEELVLLLRVRRAEEGLGRRAWHGQWREKEERRGAGGTNVRSRQVVSDGMSWGTVTAGTHTETYPRSKGEGGRSEATCWTQPLPPSAPPQPPPLCVFPSPNTPATPSHVTWLSLFSLPTLPSPCRSTAPAARLPMVLASPGETAPRRSSQRVRVLRDGGTDWRGRESKEHDRRLR